MRYFLDGSVPAKILILKLKIFEKLYFSALIRATFAFAKRERVSVLGFRLLMLWLLEGWRSCFCRWVFLIHAIGDSYQ